MTPILSSVDITPNRSRLRQRFGEVWMVVIHGTHRSQSRVPVASPRSSLTQRIVRRSMLAVQAQLVARFGKAMTVVRAFPLLAGFPLLTYMHFCLLYTSDAADEE